MEKSCYLPINFEQVLLLEDKEEKMLNDKPMTHIASETILAKDWLDPKEEEVWKDL